MLSNAGFDSERMFLFALDSERKKRKYIAGTWQYISWKRVPEACNLREDEYRNEIGLCFQTYSVSVMAT